MYSDNKDAPSLLEARARTHFSHHARRALYNRRDQLLEDDSNKKFLPLSLPVTIGRDRGILPP